MTAAGPARVGSEPGQAALDFDAAELENRIAQVAPSARTRIPDGVQITEARGKYLIPGLWDMHAHALGDGREDALLPTLVAHGVTGVRNMHTTRPLAEIVALKQAILRGERLGPRIMAAGPLVDGPHEWNHCGTLVVETPEAAVERWIPGPRPGPTHQGL